MASTSFREMTASKELKLGTCIAEFTSPGIADIMKEAGCDFVFFDMEHAGFTFETLKSVVKYMQAADLPMIVRPPSQLYTHISMACDMGAEALLLPHVRTAAEAREIVRFKNFPPKGIRGAAFGIAHDRYGSTPGREVMASANERIAFYATIEDAVAIDEIDEIIGTDGLDGIVIGHNDLSSSMGIHGEYDHEDYLAAVAQVEAACRKHEKVYGRLVTSVQEGIDLHKAGASLIMYSGDVWLLKAAVAEPLAALRERCVREPATAA